MTLKTSNNLQWPQWSVAILLVLSIMGCTSSQQANPNTLHVAITRAPITFNAQKATDATSLRALNLISFGLTKWAEDMTPAPAAAKAFQHKNYQTFILHLKKVNFQDGTPLTSTWVKSFYEEILNPQSNSPVRGQLKGLQSIQTQGPHTVIFQLKTPNPFFWSSLQIPLVKQTSAGPIGLSSYKLEKKWDNGSFQVKAMGQRQQNRPQSIKFHVVKDPTVSLLKLLKGEVDVVYNDIPAEIFAHAQSQGMVGVTSPSASYTYLGFNFRDGNETLNPLLRRAISHAINVEELQKSILKNQSSPAESLLQKSNVNFWPAPQVAYSPQKACQLLKQYKNGKNSVEIGNLSEKNGQKEEKTVQNGTKQSLCEGFQPINLTLSITTSPFILRVAQVFKQQLQQVNINLTIQAAEWGTFYNNIKKGNFQTYILTWVGRFQPNVFYSFFHASQLPPNGANRGGYNSPKMDNLIENMMQEQDDQKRIKLAQAIQKLQSEELIYLPLWRRSHTMLTGKNIKNCRLDKDAEYIGLTYCQKHT